MTDKKMTDNKRHILKKQKVLSSKLDCIIYIEIDKQQAINTDIVLSQQQNSLTTRKFAEQ